MVIYTDSREQRPLKFMIDDIVEEVKVAKLEVGDYTARYRDGSFSPIVFERKSIGDLFSTLANQRNHSRFNKEILRAKELGIKLVFAIEGMSDEIETGVPHSKVEGIRIIRSLQTIWLRYDLPHLFFPSRIAMATYIAEFFKSFGRNYKKGNKELEP